MNNSNLNFLNWKLGSEWKIPIQVEPFPGTRLKDGNFREWVTLEDGKELIASCSLGRLVLRIGVRSQKRTLRQILRSSPRPTLYRLNINVVGQDAVGSLDVLRCALPANLSDEEIVIGIPESDEFEETKSRIEQTLAEDFFIHENDQKIAIFQTSFDLITKPKAEQSTIILVNSRGRDSIECELMSGDYLKFVSFIDLNSWSIPEARFVYLQTPRVTQLAEARSNHNLSVLMPPYNVQLHGWLDYEKHQRLVREEIFERRKNHPLEYNEVIKNESTGSSINYTVRLADGSGDISKWTNDGEIRTGKNSVKAPIKLLSLHREDVVVEGELTEIFPHQGGYAANIVTEDKNVPPVQGRILAGEAFGDSTQAKRREEALQRILTGRSANSSMLRYLLNPKTIPELESKDSQLHYRKESPALNDKQKKAVIRAAGQPELFLIQGPPGTGKTTVIVEIIHQVLHRNRNRGPERGPLKILVSSIQNDAIENVSRKLRDQKLLVDAKYSGSEDLSSNSTADRLSQQLLNRIASSQTIFDLNEHKELLFQIELLSHHLRNPSDDTMGVLSQFLANPMFEKWGGIVLTQGRALCDELSTLLVQLAEPSEEQKETPFELIEALRSLVGWREADNGIIVSKNIDSALALIESNPNDGFHRLALKLRSLSRDLRRETDELSERTQRRLEELVGAIQEDLAVTDTAPDRAPQIEWSAKASTWLSNLRERVDVLMSFDSDAKILHDLAYGLENAPNRLQEIEREYATISLRSCQKSSEFFKDNESFDVVIIDEAGRGGLDVLIPMSLGKSVILVGDQNQLPPHVEAELEQRLEEEVRREADLHNTSLFSYLWHELQGEQRFNCVALDTQFRMHSDIGQVVSHAFYEPEMKLKHSQPNETVPPFGLLGNTPFVWLDTSDQIPPTETFAYENFFEVQLVRELLSQVDSEALESLQTRHNGRKPIGLIPLYKKQSELLQRTFNNSPLKDFVEIGTADSFQGKEYPLVIISCVRSNPHGNVGFLQLPNRLNVAISRAMNQVILVGDSRTLTHPNRGSAPFKKVWTFVQEPQNPGVVLNSRSVLNRRKE